MSFDGVACEFFRIVGQTLIACVLLLQQHMLSRSLKVRVLKLLICSGRIDDFDDFVMLICFADGRTECAETDGDSVRRRKDGRTGGDEGYT